MADETTQTGEETSWWALDVFADSELPSTAFDEPLQWPETLDWGSLPVGDGDLQFPDNIDDLPSDAVFPAEVPDPPASTPSAPAPEARWDVADDGGDQTMPHVTVLSGLGGGAGSPAPAPAGDEAAHERPDSLWAPDPAAGSNGNGNGSGVAPLVTTTMAAPSFYAEPDRRPVGWRRRFDIRHGNAAIIALISFASLVLLGMFMSVRARNDVPDTSRTRTTSDQIAVQAPLSTVPLTTTVTTTAPPAINIADLIPPEETTTATAGSGAGGSTATTAAPARSTAAGGGTATTQPAAQAPATTAAPQPTTEPEITTAPTTPPIDQTTPTAPSRSTPTPTFVWPTSIPNNDDGPSYTIPPMRGFRFPNIDND